MSQHERRRTLPPDRPPRTTPAEAEEPARKRRGDRARDAHGMDAKSQSPGLGREEQRRPHEAGNEAAGAGEGGEDAEGHDG
ncbi:hypothetical protein ACIGO8_27620 [Streptomyces sp. NPDC053493]|uniref:hypothetical protein n=1 Tax=Streptomyces sp. NPDC053493 TaxID=3365705 RepID=UPI0037CF806E